MHGANKFNSFFLVNTTLKLQYNLNRITPIYSEITVSQRWDLIA